MSETITAVYEKGVLRPLKPLSLPESTHVEIRIIAQAPVDHKDRQQVRQALEEAGMVRPRATNGPVELVSESRLTEAANALAKAGPLSEQIIADREGR
jgi:predicted DNA-binding antitoxin AbrB/MazE fold protein